MWKIFLAMLKYANLNCKISLLNMVKIILTSRWNTHTVHREHSHSGTEAVEKQQHIHCGNISCQASMRGLQNLDTYIKIKI